jgi:putative transposase
MFPVQRNGARQLCNNGTALAGPREKSKKESGFSLCHGASSQKRIRSEHPEPCTNVFVTTSTAMSKRMFQSERNAGLMIEVLRALVAEKAIELHDFVIMPDHLHLMLTVHEEMTIEKAMQLIKGRFSFRIKKECGYLGEVWQRGFTEEQVMSRTSFEAHRAYIAMNPVKAGLVSRPEDFPYCFESLAKNKSGARRTEEKVED